MTPFPISFLADLPAEFSAPVLSSVETLAAYVITAGGLALGVFFGLRFTEAIGRGIKAIIGQEELRDGGLSPDMDLQDRVEYWEQEVRDREALLARQELSTGVPELDDDGYTGNIGDTSSLTNSDPNSENYSPAHGGWDALDSPEEQAYFGTGTNSDPSSENYSPAHGGWDAPDSPEEQAHFGTGTNSDPSSENYSPAHGGWDAPDSPEEQAYFGAGTNSDPSSENYSPAHGGWDAPDSPEEQEHFNR